ncbi:MAG TPA: FtsX-like permease family protein, partial [Acidimicrobiales bacterium]
EVRSDLRFIVERATAVRDDVRRVVLPLASATVVAATLMVVLVGALWVDRHEREVALLEALGVSRAAIVARAVVEVAPPAVSGAAIGAFLAVPVASAVGPRAVGFGDVASAVAVSVPALVACAVTFAAGVALRRRSRPRHARAALVTVAIVEAASVAAATATALVLGDDSGGGAMEPRTVLAAVAFVVSATTAALLPLIVAMRVVAGRIRGRRPVVMLATRRLVADAFPTAAVVGIASACVGLFAFGTILEGSARRTVDAKAGVFAGAPVSVVAPDLERVPAALAGRATPVRWLADVSTPEGEVDVLAVDPATFADAAFWDGSLAEISLDTAMDRLRAGARAGGGAAPAIVVGRVPASTHLESPDLDVQVVARARAFPGMRSRPLVVVSDAAVAGAGGERRLWARASLDEVSAALRTEGVDFRRPVTTAAVFDAPAFYTLQWSFGFVRGTAALAAAVATVGFLVHLDLRRRRAVAAEVVLTTMGMARRAQAASRVIELVVALAVGCALGTALAVLAASGSHRTVDLTPYVPPAAILSVPAKTLALAALAVVASVPLLAAAVYLRSPGSPAKVLRSELV